MDDDHIIYQDPNLDPKYAEMLKRQCLQRSTNPNLVAGGAKHRFRLANQGLFASGSADKFC
ncbi:peroxidase 5-like protein [Corchorus olitorius]|uniref:Peroxidase 5-like protein n=1 Tax=Corchorus olitorius TaxID=93759 RepID=A0A1R3KRR0_9ROSI|nr:peroxidase 5-like protein [Corchorus olitorius]